jgi:hypothetical protein
MATMAKSANPPVRRFFGDARSLKSFRDNTPSIPPSEVKSLKTKKSLNLLMPSILGLKRSAQKGSPDVNSGMRREEVNAEGVPVEKKTEEMPM